MKTQRMDSPQAYLLAFQNQQVDYRNRSKSQYSDFSNKNQVKPINQKFLVDYSPYDICIPNNNIASQQQRSSSMQNSSQYLQETSDKTQRDQDSDGSFSGLIKYLENQKCFEYSKQVKCLLNNMNKLKEENLKLKKRQLDVISLLSSANSYQSPFREKSQNQVSQKPILSSPKNLVDDNEESNSKGYYKKDSLSKNLFQTFDSASQISPIQNHYIKSPESCLSIPFSQSSIEKEIKKENICQPYLYDLQQQPNQIITQFTNIQNNVQKQQNKNDQLKQQNYSNNQNGLNKQSFQNKSQPQQTNKNQQKQILQVKIQNQKKDTSQYKQVSDIISQSQYNSYFQTNDASNDIGRKTATFLDSIIIQPTQANKTANLKNNHKKTVIKPYNRLKDSLKLQKNTYCKSNSPQRSRKNNNTQNKSQPRKNFV
ncbi:hypothetical protein TTHERM_00564490 (macronuclear) [Tetrahymena thermophila SB210]|uniref:Uncharacterized protein n=1 Tax=Tetrahymena thermophila (strain SB210) TaxID=312017 RepID=I7M302_TETTS|nr:hypothetical protein TTHERM_00564490 [Tetrahymena thermophila SB210]EAS01803.2 hypothetical protein TTHERM_00564490 [Tetrahymena thermophila SB210]|eukprot:XP_001022048.2 hypothetical protein TTHERM_00564490 [Tetrahymena thermophila SB210]